MSATATMPIGSLAADLLDGSKAAPVAVTFKFNQTEKFPALLKQLGISLMVTTYQANKLLVLREQADGLSILVRSFERPMGLAVDGRRIALGTRDQVWQFRNAPDIAACTMRASCRAPATSLAISASTRSVGLAPRLMSCGW